ncbi:hypothetical protein CU044_3735 [Streptomyces sp. L-9-10]|nr:hypothetical protein CU044_3735 [Streptomyces sp. L-9-10]
MQGHGVLLRVVSGCVVTGCPFRIGPVWLCEGPAGAGVRNR